MENRGGDGIERHITCFEEMDVSILSGRRIIAPMGLMEAEMALLEGILFYAKMEVLKSWQAEQFKFIHLKQ